MNIKEKYRLYLSWKDISYSDTKVYLVQPFFFGPAVKIAAQVNHNDFIDMDLSKQHSDIIKTWDIVRFSWNTVVSQFSSKVRFDYGVLESPELTKVKILDRKDLILIDTEDHEDDKHVSNLVYKSFICNRDGLEYDYAVKYQSRVIT